MNVKPTKKMGTAGVVGAIATLVIAALQHYQIQVDAGTASAITFLLTFVAGWLKKE